MRNEQILYLHGLVSGPQSLKAQLFYERLAAQGLDMVLPDLNEDDFHGLTTTRAVALATGLALKMPPPVVIIGSSFGGRVAARVAAKIPNHIGGLVLMAPAFFLEGIWAHSLTQAERDAWRDTGALPVSHPAHPSAPVTLGYGFFEDALGTDGFPDLPPSLPVLILHGQDDAVVPLSDSERFAAGRPGRQLVVLTSDHDLNDQHERLWQEAWPFVKRCLGLSKPAA